MQKADVLKQRLRRKKIGSPQWRKFHGSVVVVEFEMEGLLIWDHFETKVSPLSKIWTTQNLSDQKESRCSQISLELAYLGKSYPTPVAKIERIKETKQKQENSSYLASLRIFCGSWEKLQLRGRKRRGEEKEREREKKGKRKYKNEWTAKLGVLIYCDI